MVLNAKLVRLVRRLKLGYHLEILTFIARTCLAINEVKASGFLIRTRRGHAPCNRM
jgi:hypothetical protein